MRDWHEFQTQLPGQDANEYASHCPLHMPLWDLIFSPPAPIVIAPARLVIPNLRSENLLGAQSMPSVLFEANQAPINSRRLEENPIIASRDILPTDQRLARTAAAIENRSAWIYIPSKGTFYLFFTTRSNTSGLHVDERRAKLWTLKVAQLRSVISRFIPAQSQPLKRATKERLVSAIYAVATITVANINDLLE